MTNIEKLIEKYGIEIVKRIPEKQGHLSHVITYGMQISMYDLIEHLKMSECIASYKHLIGCDFKHINQKGEYIKRADLGIWNIDKGFVSVQDNANHIYQLKNIKLYLDDGTHVNDSATLGTYEDYMQLHYPEYVHVWSQQL